jgi:hypothetical protein
MSSYLAQRVTAIGFPERFSLLADKFTKSVNHSV